MDALPLRTILDPSNENEFAKGSVRIPLNELTARVSELPPKGSAIQVAAKGKLLDDAIQLLTQMGRHPVPADPWELQDSPSPGRLWHVAGICEWVQENLRPGTAVDLGCGTGRNAVYLSANGWNVTGYDHLPDALQMAATLAYHHNVDCSLQVANIDDPLWAPTEMADLVLCTYYWHENLFERAATWIRPGGILAVETFDSNHREHAGHPRNPARVLMPKYPKDRWNELHREGIKDPSRSYMRLILERSSSTL
ncbi:MAG: methyltransferase domain-containing protein [Fimbriimonas sp.]